MHNSSSHSRTKSLWYFKLSKKKSIFFGFKDKELIQRIKEVSVDSLNLTIEFNEFLNMMSNFANDSLSVEGLIAAFRYVGFVNCQSRKNNCFTLMA